MMKVINSKGELVIDLYHGTSSIFLDSIISNGLGGIDPIAEWDILELSKEVYTLSEQYLQETDLFRNASDLLNNMVEQYSGGSNFQHGNTYLSPSRFTAVNYSASAEYGSELLSYTMRFLKKLNDRNIPNLKELRKKYKNIFDLINVRPAPILVEVK